jgi:signal transduction histidine kinase/PAS domain-containing protein
MHSPPDDSPAAPHSSEGPARFLARLAEAVQTLVEPAEVMQTAARMLAEFLHVDRCAYAEVEDESTFVITGDYGRGVPSIVGRWPVAAFGRECVRAMLAGEPFVITDVDADPRITADDRPAYRATDIAAVICCSLHKDGKFTAAVAVHQKTPRAWTSSEIDLVRSVVARCWEALERLRVTRTLAESRSRLDYAARISGVGFWYCDLPFDVLIWDDRVREHFWIRDDHAVTLDEFFERLHPDDREPTRQAIDRSIRERRPYDVDYRTVDPESGSLKWIRACGGTGYGSDGTPIRFDGVTLDVTARKIDEERLARSLAREREQARRMRRVADAALRIHSSGTLDSVSRVLAEEARLILNAEAAATTLVGDRPDHALAVATTDARSAHGNAEFARAAERLVHLVHRQRRASRLTVDQLAARNAEAVLGRTVVELPDRGWLGMSLVGRGGRILGSIQVFDKLDGGFLDADEAILEQLAYAAAVAIDNARLNGELRDQDRRKDEFLAILAHELRNPLAPLRNGLEVLRLTGDASDGGAAEVREMMDRQLSHMVRLIDDLLDVSRISRNKLQLRLERISLSDVVRSAVETVRPAIDAAEHVLTVSIPPEPVYLHADLTRLAQVLGNLLSNSAKYGPRGSSIRLSAAVDGTEAVVSVSDTGIGIPAASLLRIFDMFSQVDRSIERSTGGMGIGLALVKGLVEMHGGTVEAASPGPGLGSTFTVRLPLYVEKPREGDAPSDAGIAPAAPRTKRRILVVDDNRDAARSMAMMLELMGNEVSLAHDGLEGVAAADRFRPSVIFMDVGMPNLNGYDAARRIRSLAWDRQPKILALTGWGQEVDRTRSREAGCDGHLVKPVSAADLERALAES